MNNELTCTALAERFNKALEKFKQDKETMEKIKARSLWKIIFSNNIRDLARAGISQNEIISEMHLVLQDMLELIQKSGEQQKGLMEELHEAVRRQAGVNADFNEKIIRLVTDLLSQSVQLEELENKTTDIQCRLIQKEQIENAETEIVKIALRKEMQPLKKFEHICKSIAHHLAGYSIRDISKQKLCLCLKREFGNRLFSSKELNSIQAEIGNIFAPFRDSRNQHVSAIGQFLFDGIALPEGEYLMNEMLTSIVDAVMISEAERYSQFRDQLIRLLDQFPLKTDEAARTYTEALTAIRKRLKENQFEIALIGEFQGGKSTTFNMLCGGREISPRGLNGGGLKTSAAVITVQNIEGEETRNGLKEWAEINWLSSKQLKERIIDVLKDYDEEQTRLEYDTDPKSKKRIPNPEKSSWDAIYELLKIAWGQKPRGEVDCLQIATLQYRLCNSKKFDKTSKKKIVPVDQFQKWVKFPDDWKVRWANKFKAKFSLDEMLFVAVDRVLVRIHSDALAYLGCRITDCPGLFVNEWDTERAIDAMGKAHAIWYLLNGDKESDENDSRMLQKIIGHFGWHEKCFFTINRRKGKGNTTDIMKADIEKLTSQGFNPEHVFVYDAFLAFRLQQLKQLDAGSLMSWDLECLANEATKNSVQAELKELKAILLI